jgi:hypothetical protein
VVINFRDWSLSECEKYPDLLDIVIRLVKPERDRNRDRSRREYWWRFTRPAPELYRAIEGLDHCLAISRVSNVVLPLRVPTGPVFDVATQVFALKDFASLAELSSNVHQVWVVRYASTLETRIRYAHTDVFVTFPRPISTDRLSSLGARLDAERRDLMLERAWGLTTAYNHVHDPAVSDESVVALRDLHTEIDIAVFDAYGWSDLDPEVGHHETKIGIRWTLSPRVRFEVLDRLLAENHRRFAIERGQLVLNGT